MPQIPRISQVPIIEPMYTNGVMNPVWVRFFEKLASMLNTGDLADNLTLMQLANQLPVQASIGQMMLDAQDLQFPILPISIQPSDVMPVVPVAINPDSYFDMVAMPTSEIITNDSIPQPI